MVNKVIRRIRRYYSRIKRYITFFFSKKKKFDVGAGVVNYNKEWYETDINTLNITKEFHWRRLLFFFKLDNIFAEHVWEHLSDNDSERAIKNCYKFLKKNGVLRIAVPDGYHPEQTYIDYVKPGGSGAGAHDHKILYNYQSIRDRLSKVGFKVEFLEYWDENGQFHYTEWNDVGGHVERSKRYDERNKNGQLNYTSLIVDAIKP